MPWRHPEVDQDYEWSQIHAEMTAADQVPSHLELFKHWMGAAVVEPPMKVAQAAKRANVDEQTIRRRLNQWSALDPPLAYKVGRVWRILPVALEQMKLPRAENPTAKSKRRKGAASGPDSEVW
jgi:hypothetical protein